jgi:hypothetical protein
MRIAVAIFLFSFFAVPPAQSQEGRHYTTLRTTFEADKDVKIVLDTLEIFMSRTSVVKYLKVMQKNGHGNTKILRKKMNGVCFSEINLRTDIPDQEITAIQKLLRERIVRYAICEGNAGLKPKSAYTYCTSIIIESDKKPSADIPLHFFTEDKLLNFIL